MGAPDEGDHEEPGQDGATPEINEETEPNEPTRTVRILMPEGELKEIYGVPMQATVSVLRARLEQLPGFVTRRGVAKIRMSGRELDGASVLPDEGELEFVFEEARRGRLIIVTSMFFFIHAMIYPALRRWGGSVTLALYAAVMCVFGTVVGPVEAAASNRVLRCVGQVIGLFIRSFSPTFELEHVLQLPPL